MIRWLAIGLAVRGGQRQRVVGERMGDEALSFAKIPHRIEAHAP